MPKKNNKKDFNSNMMKKLGGNFVLWILIIVISVTILQYLTVNNRYSEITYSQFNSIYKEQNQNIEKIIIEGKIVKGACFEASPCIDNNGNDISKFSVTLPELTNELVDEWVVNSKKCIQIDRGISIPGRPIGVDFEIGPSWGELENYE